MSVLVVTVDLVDCVRFIVSVLVFTIDLVDCVKFIVSGMNAVDLLLLLNQFTIVKAAVIINIARDSLCLYQSL